MATGSGSGMGGRGGAAASADTQNPSKRDKRRNLLSDRLSDLSTNFDRERDVHYRNQLTALQQDFNAIARADTSGKDLQMLDDGGEEIDMLVTGGMFLGDSAYSNVRGGPVGAPPIQPTSYYAEFVAEVNEKMEERDVGLAILHVSSLTNPLLIYRMLWLMRFSFMHIAPIPCQNCCTQSSA